MIPNSRLSSLAPQQSPGQPEATQTENLSKATTLFQTDESVIYHQRSGHKIQIVAQSQMDEIKDGSTIPLIRGIIEMRPLKRRF